MLLHDIVLECHSNWLFEVHLNENIRIKSVSSIRTEINIGLFDDLFEFIIFLNIDIHLSE